MKYGSIGTTGVGHLRRSVLLMILALTVAFVGVGSVTSPAHAATSYTATTTYTSPAVVGTATTSTTKLTASATASNVVVYLEIDDASGAAVAKKDYSNQSLSAVARDFTIDFTPTKPGLYTTKVMVFTANWATVLFFEPNSKDVTVGITPIAPPATSTTTASPTTMTPAPTSTSPTSTAVPSSTSATSSSSPTAFSASTVYSSPASVGSTITGTASVAVPSPLANVIVYLEVRTSGGVVVSKRGYKDQNLTAAAQQYQIIFAPTTAGGYTTKVQVYSADWSKRLHEQRDSGSVDVRAGSGTTAPTSPSPTSTSPVPTSTSTAPTSTSPPTGPTSTSAPPTSGIPSVPPTTTAEYSSLTAYSAPAVAGQTISGMTRVTAPNTMTGVIVYLEVDDSLGVAVAKKDFQNVTLSPASQNFTFPFTVPDPGIYTTKVQVYSIGWSKRLYSNTVSGTANVGGGGSTPSPSSPTSTASPTTSPTASPTPTRPATWGAQAQYSSPTGEVGSALTITTAVTAPQPVSGSIVQIYIEGPTSTKQFDYTNQTIGTSPKRFVATFTPTDPGLYTVKVGVFSAGFQTLYYWSNLAGVFQATSSGTVPTAPTRIFGTGLTPRVLAMGDSITYGINGDSTAGTGGYRPTLWNTITAQGFSVNPVGPQNAPPSGSRHAGWPGWRIRDLANGVPGLSPSAVSMMNAYEPDVVLLHIGTNDFGFDDDEANAANRAKALIDSMVAARPGAFIFVARIIDTYSPVPETAVRSYNDAVQAHVNTLATQGKRVYSVDMSAAVTKSADLGDGVHPRDSTYARMAQIWYARLAAVNSGL